MSDNHNKAYSNPDREQSDCFPFITLDHDHDSYAASRAWNLVRIHSDACIYKEIDSGGGGLADCEDIGVQRPIGT